MEDLRSLIRHKVLANIPIFHSSELYEFTLHGVEEGGLWLENDKTTQQILKAAGLGSSPRAVIFFIPFDKINFIIRVPRRTTDLAMDAPPSQ